MSKQLRAVLLVFCLYIGQRVQASTTMVPFTTYRGTIPSAVFSLNLQAGQYIQITAYAPFTTFECYLYSEGQDLLDTSNYIWHEAITSTHQTNGTGQGKYYLRYNRISGSPFISTQMYINNTMLWQSDVSIQDSSVGMTFIPIQVNNDPCTYLITYTDDSGYPISVHDMQSDLTDLSAAAATNSSSQKTKTLQVTLDNSVQYLFVIHHGLSSTTTLQDFYVTIQVDNNPSCASMCTKPLESILFQYGCSCFSHPNTISGGFTDCQLNCATTLYSIGDDPSDPNACLCENGRQWDPEWLNCRKVSSGQGNQKSDIIDCSTIPNAFQNSQNGCACRQGFQWVHEETKCRMKQALLIGLCTGGGALAIGIGIAGYFWKIRKPMEFQPSNQMENTGESMKGKRQTIEVVQMTSA